MCAALSESLDEAVRALADEGLPDRDVALVATGGYGRGELSPFSDVDLMVLHRLDDASGTASAVFRPLWDAGLKVGHAVRTVREAGRAARERFDIFTTLLAGRLVWGDAQLFDAFSEEMSSISRARPLRRHLVEAETARRRASPYLLMATDVKSGRGGLRTLHGFDWERLREELIGRFSRASTPEEETARESLLRIRNALHAVTGRRYDIFSFDVRQPVARWLGGEVYEVSRELVGAIESVDRLATLRWPELLAVGESLGSRVWMRITGAGSATTEDEPRSPDEFAAVLRMGERGRSMLDRMRESGSLQRLLPQWETIRVAPQLAPFHEHPVEAHLWRTVDEMGKLATGDDQHFSGIAQEIGSADLLALVAFLHDIGKGGGGNHAEVGAGIAEGFCRRLGCAPGTTALVGSAVRHHLLLGETATRRDLDDPAVIEEIVATVTDLRHLQVLYLLTVADSRATGATMWNRWKATLVRTLFIRCAARFGGEEPVPADVSTTRKQVLSQVGSGLRGVMEAHLDGMPTEYLRGTGADDVIWHFGLLQRLDGESDLEVRPGPDAEKVVVVGRGSPSFHRLVAESFAANGIDVLEARLATRVDGIVVDGFRVRDDRTGGPVPAARWDRVGSDIEAALTGFLDTEAKVAARVEAYASVAAAEIQPRVTVVKDETSGAGLVTVRCSDRIGRLAEVLSILHTCGLEIRLAKLDARAGEVVDTFHVSGVGLEDPGGLGRLETRIEEMISS